MIEVEDEAEDVDNTGVLAVAVEVDTGCVVPVPLEVVGVAPAPMTGLALGPPGTSWGAGARFLRKRLWLTL